MEKFDLYMSSVETESIFPGKENVKCFRLVGMFRNEEDAKNAAKLYEIVYKAHGAKIFHNYIIEKKSYPKDLSKTSYKTYFGSLDEFIQSDRNIMEYIQINKLTADELLSQINENDSKIEKELRIIERLIKEYNDKLHFALRTSSTSEESIEKIEESIKYLESLRDEKSGFTK